MAGAIQRAYEWLLWAVFAVFLIGGIPWSGLIRFTHMAKVWAFLGVMYLLLRFALGFQFRNTLFGRNFIAALDALLAAYEKRSMRPFGKLGFPATLFLFAALYVLVFFVMTPWMEHWVFGTAMTDLGIFENAFYNATQTGLFQTHTISSTVDPVKFIPNNHLSLGLYLLLPFYWLVPRTETLLLLQSLVLILPLFPLYRLSKLLLSRRGSKAVPIWVPILAYILWNPIHTINLWDFHATPFMIVFSLWAFYFIETKRLGWAVLHLFLMAIWREDAWWTFSAMAIYMGVRTGAWKLALPLSLLGAFLFPAHFLIFNEVNTAGERYAHFGNSLGEILKTVVLQPWVVLQTIFRLENLEYFGKFILFTGGGIVFFSRWALLPVLPILLLCGLSQYWGMLEWDTHYVAGMAGPIFFAMLLGWKNGAAKWVPYPVSLALILCLFETPMPGRFRANMEYYEGSRCFDRLISKIDDREGVVAVEPFVSHLSRRSYLMQPAGVDQSQARWLVVKSRQDVRKFGNSFKPVKEDCGYVLARRDD